MKRCIIFLSFILFAISCSQKQVGPYSSEKALLHRLPLNHPLVETVEDPGPSFTIDPTKPFTIAFGRGSGLEGLDTVKMDENGKVILHRIQFEKRSGFRYPYWETGTMQLFPDDIEAILDSLHRFHLFKMHKEYYGNVHDGTQWVLWITQEQHEKSIYCSNHFPENILAFSDFLDELFTKRGLADVTWTRVPESESRNHEKELWESIR